MIAARLVPARVPGAAGDGGNKVPLIAVLLPGTNADLQNRGGA